MKNIPGNYYNKHKSANPIVKYLMKNFHDTLFEMIHYVSPVSMLDVGCGEGYSLKQLKDKYPELDIEATDVEQEIIEIARRENPDINFKVESAYAIDKPDGSYDLVTALEVLEHLEYPDKAIAEAKRLTKRYCIFSVPFEPCWRILNIMRLKYLSDLGNTPGHINHWGRDDFRKLLSKHFKNVKIRTVFPWNFALCFD